MTYTIAITIWLLFGFVSYLINVVVVVINTVHFVDDAPWTAFLTRFKTLIKRDLTKDLKFVILITLLGLLNLPRVITLIRYSMRYLDLVHLKVSNEIYGKGKVTGPVFPTKFNKNKWEVKVKFKHYPHQDIPVKINSLTFLVK